MLMIALTYYRGDRNQVNCEVVSDELHRIDTPNSLDTHDPDKADFDKVVYSVFLVEEQEEGRRSQAH